MNHKLGSMSPGAPFHSRSSCCCYCSVLYLGDGAAASDFNEVTELGNLLSQSVGLVSGDELQLVIIPFVTVYVVATETGLPRFDRSQV
jgi:hypothetical protein